MVLDGAVWTAAAALVLGAVAVPTSATAGDPLRVYAEGEPPRDARLGSLRDLNSGFPFTPVSTPEEWAERAECGH